jgi:hypothetical protein
MLTPEQIDAVRLQAEALTRPVVEFLIEDIARRISEAGQLTSTAQYQIWRAQNLGLSQKEIQDRLKKLLNVSEKQIKALLTQSAKVGYRFDLSRLPTAEAIPFEDNTVIQQIVSAAVEMAQADFSNITQTLGMVDPCGNALPLQKAYQQCMDFAFEKVATGAEDMNSAVRKATKNLADKGIRVIDYESGVHRSIEAATRGCIMGALGLMQEKISQHNHDDMGANGWEISAHAASAPDHEPIQGKQYSDAEYEELNNSLARRIGTLNCGHAAFPIILGVSTPQYTEEELAQFKQDNAKGIDYEGRHYSMYEATQQQRKLERTMRKQKNRILVDEATGDKEKLQVDQIRLRQISEEYNRFSKAAGLRTQPHRAQVAGFGVKQAGAAQTTAKQHKAFPTIEKEIYAEKQTPEKTMLQTPPQDAILTEDDEQFLYQYKSAEGYLINAALRGEMPMPEEYQFVIDGIDRAMSKLPEYKGTVYRSLRSEEMWDPDAFLAQHIVDQYVSYPAYTSASTEIYDETMDIQLVIQCHSGRDMRKINPLEQEILFNRNTRFLVEKVEGKTIWLTEI